MSAPKNEDSQKNIHCLIQFLDLQRGCQDFHSLKVSKKADGREKPSSGGAETPPNTLTVEITRKLSFEHIRTSKPGQSGIRTWSHLRTTCPLALGAQGFPLLSSNDLNGAEKQWEKFTGQNTVIPPHEVALQPGKEILYMR